jgi:hypothetical protein
MISQTHSSEGLHSHRIAFAPLPQKRRCKLDESGDSAEHEPVLIDARMELRRQQRIHRSGRPNIQWRRLTSSTEFSELLPPRSRPPMLALVVDKVKNPQRANRQGLWSWLRCWALAR